MKKIVLLTSLVSMFFLSSAPIGVTQNVSRGDIFAPRRNVIKGGSQTLRLLNWEDYIYLNDPDNGYYEDDMVDQFEEYARSLGYTDVEVVYSTTDTVETMLNELETGKAHFDLICPSDYGIQKLMANDMLVNLRSLMDEYQLTTYDTYVSKTIQNYLYNLEATSKATNELLRVSDYAYGYMWGTLGLLFNPEYDLYKNNGISPEKVITDMMDYSVLWDTEYNGSISLKDSIRDTYFVGLAQAKRDLLLSYMEDFENGLLTKEEYNQKLSVELNDASPEAVEMVKNVLLDVKKNIFGLEVDSGKQDIVKGTIGINLAWSGDSVYSIDLADAYNEEVGNDVEYGICYSVPETGANIWFDGWCMPKDARSEAQQHLACLFIDFISDPENAAKNTSYIGYTPFIGGDEVLDLMRDWYDIRTELIYYYDEEGEYETDDERYLSLYYVDPLTLEECEVWYEDVHSIEDNDPIYDDVELYYYLSDEELANLEVEGQVATYNDYLVMDFDEYEEVDLSYFFNESLTEYEDGVDTLFYSDCYLPYTYIDENGNEVQNRCVGRQFFTQFPAEDTIYRCVMMRDFGENNDNVRIMWEDFKANIIEPWIYIVFGVVVGLILLGFGINYSQKMIKKNNRNNRLKEKREKK